MKFVFAAIGLCLCLVGSGGFLFPVQTIDRLTARMTSRQVSQGKSVTLRGELFYQRNGNMLTRLTYPKELIILANRLGETRVYDPGQNTVILYQNPLFSTQTTQLAVFLTGNATDMGLTHIGYVQKKTSYAKNLFVTDWALKQPDKKALIQRVRLVYSGSDPIYMHYTDGNDRILRKVFYANYQTIGARRFPTSTTDIVYEKGDSSVTKTTYGDFRLNQQAQSPYFQYGIPANAKIQRS